MPRAARIRRLVGEVKVASGSPTRRRAVWAAGSVVLGALVAAGINVLTGDWSWTVAGAVAIAVLAWAGLEWRRAAGEDRAEQSGAVNVVQNVRRVAGRMTGARRRANTSETKVEQKIDEVAPGGEVTGYTNDSR